MTNASMFFVVGLISAVASGFLFATITWKGTVIVHSSPGTALLLGLWSIGYFLSAAAEEIASAIREGKKRK